MHRMPSYPQAIIDKRYPKTAYNMILDAELSRYTA